jgi:WD40 repeat protein
MSAVPPGERSWIEEQADRFERAWRAGQQPRIEDYLAGVVEPRRSRLLEELLRVEDELRRGRGAPADPEEYRRRFPEDVAVVDAVFGTAPHPAPAARGRPARADADRNLLFGVLALQMDFISREALIKAVSAWIRDKAKPLAQILVEQGALPEARRALLEPLVEEHLRLHDDDAEKSLGSVSSLGSVREALATVADAEVQASLDHIGAAREDDSDRTASWSAGRPTSGAGRFRILRFHDRGGRGEVYVAHDEELAREVALKQIQGRYADDPEVRSRFLLEGEITGGLEHPGIVPVYGLGHYEDGRPFYAMRFIKGDSLRKAIARFHQATDANRDPGERALELRRLLGRFLDVCNAVAYAHSRGVLHRDLKPGNILLGPYGETLVVDWGMAKVVSLGEAAPSDREATLWPPSAGGGAATMPGSAIGTPGYMSPEQAAGQLDRLGPASDVYSLGATLYCLLTGRAPFPGEDLNEVLHRVQAGDFPPPRQINRTVAPALEAICLKAMALEPEARYRSPRALAEDIEHWLADEPVSALPESAPQRLARWGRRHRTWIQAGTAALLLVTLILAAAIFVTERARRAEKVQRTRAEEAAYDARLSALEQMQARIQGQLNQAQILYHSSQADRQNQALSLLNEAGKQRQGLDHLLAQLGDDPRGGRSRAQQFWSQILPSLRQESIRWLTGTSLNPLAPLPFPAPISEPFVGGSILLSQLPVDLAISPDGRTLAFLRPQPRDGEPQPRHRIEVIDAASGKLVGGFGLGEPEKGIPIALAYGAGSHEVLLLNRRVDQGFLPNLALERRLWPTGELKGTIRLAGLGRLDPREPPAPTARWIFSPDRKRLASVPDRPMGLPPGPSAIWDCESGAVVREFETDFTPQGFSTSGAIVVGLAGGEVQLRDVASGRVVKRLTLPQERVPLAGRARMRPQQSPPGPNIGRESPYINESAATMLQVSPGGRWVAAVSPSYMTLQSYPPQFPIDVLILDAEKGQVTGRFPLPPAMNTFQSQGVLPLIAFGGHEDVLVVITAQQLVILSVPDGKPMLVAELPERLVDLPLSPDPPRPRKAHLPLKLVVEPRGSRIVSVSLPGLRGSPFDETDRRFVTGGRDLVLQAWDLSLARLKPERRTYQAPISAVRFSRSGRYMVASGEDRKVHLVDRQGPGWAAGYLRRAGYFGRADSRLLHLTQWSDGSSRIVRYGRFDPSGRVLITRLPDRVELWDGTTGRMRRSFPASVDQESWDPSIGQATRTLPTSWLLAASADWHYLAVTDRPLPRGAIRVLGVSEDEWLLTLPAEMSRVEFASNSRHLVAQGFTKGGQESEAVIADLAERRIVSRLGFGERWWFGPAGRNVAVYGRVDRRPVLRVIELATGRTVGELVDPIPDLSLSSNSLEVWFSRDDARIALLAGGRPPATGDPVFAFHAWDPGEGKTFRLASDRVSSTDAQAWYSSDGSRLAVFATMYEQQPGSRLAAVELWDIKGTRRLMSTTPKEATGFSVTDSLSRHFLTVHDDPGRLLVKVREPGNYSEPGIYVVHDIATGQAVARYPDPQARSRVLGEYLYRTVGNSPTQESTLLNWVTDKVVLKLAGSPELEIDPDRRIAVTNDRYGPTRLSLWDLSEGRRIAELARQRSVMSPRPNGEISQLLSPDGKLLATQGEDDRPALNLWETRTGKLVLSIPMGPSSALGPGQVDDAQFSPDGTRMALVVNGRYRILDIPSQRILSLDRPGHLGAVRAVDLSPDETLVVSAGDDGTACFWEAASGRFAGLIEGETGPIRQIAFSLEGRHAIVLDAAGVLRALTLERSTRDNRIAVRAELVWKATASTFVALPDGQTLALGGKGGIIEIRELDGGRILRELKDDGRSGTSRALAVPSDGSLLISADDDGTLRTWDVRQGTPTHRWKTNQNPIRAVACGDDGLVAVAAGEVEIWHAGRGERLLNLEGHKRPINALSFSPDGQSLASASDDQTVVVWDLRQIRQQLTKLGLGW